MTLAQQATERLFYTTREVAAALSCSPQHVRDLIESGQLRGDRSFGRNIRVPASEYRRFLGATGPAHEAVSSRPTPERSDTLRELRMKLADCQRLLAELEG